MGAAELSTMAIAGAFWIAIARALTVDVLRHRPAIIAIIAVVIPCLLFVGAWLVGAEAKPVALGAQIVGVACFWVVFGRPGPRAGGGAAERCASCSAELGPGVEACGGCGARIGRGRSRTGARL